MRRTILYLIAMIVIAGCMPTRWSWQHPGNPGPEQLAQDKQTCDTISSEEMSYPYPPIGYRPHFHYYRPWPYYGYDMYWPYGYGWYDDPFVYQNYRDDLFRVCMRAKGWRLVPEKNEETGR